MKRNPDSSTWADIRARMAQARERVADLLTELARARKAVVLIRRELHRKGRK